MFTVMINLRWSSQMMLVLLKNRSSLSILQVSMIEPFVSSGIYASAEKGDRNENKTAYQMIQGTYEGTDADEYGESGPELSFNNANYTSNNGDIGINGNYGRIHPRVETNSDQFTVTVTDSQGNETNQVINLSFYNVDTKQHS